jgi:hypothetical protein
VSNERSFSFNETNSELPYNDYLEYYGPDYRLHIEPSNMENLNTKEYLIQNMYAKRKPQFILFVYVFVLISKEYCKHVVLQKKSERSLRV